MENRDRALRGALELIQAGQYRQAEALLLHLQNGDGRDPACWALRGVLYHAVGDYRKAMACTQGAIDYGACSSESYVNLASSAAMAGCIPEASAAYKAALALDPELAHVRLEQCLDCLLDVPSSTADAAHMVQRFSEAALELAQWNAAASGRQRALAGYANLSAPFLLAYQLGNHTPALSSYGTLVGQAMALHGTCPKPAAKVLVPGHKLRLLVVSAHIRRHSVADMLLEGLLEHLDRHKFEVALFYTATKFDDTTQRISTRVDHFVMAPAPLGGWIARVAAFAPDVIYYPEVGMDAATFRLASLRQAPRQIASWGHPLTTGLPTIDGFLSGELIEAESAAEQYSETLIRLPGTGAMPRVRLDPACYRAVEQLWPNGRPDCPIFIIPHSDFKLHPAFDSIYPAIARRVGTCKFLFFNDPTFAWRFEKTMTRLRGAFHDAGLNPDDHLLYAPWTDPANFAGFMSTADIYLDPPAFSGFTTAWQAIRLSLPLVTWEGPSLRQRLAGGVLRSLGLNAQPVHSRDGYIDLATRLALHPDRRKEVANEIRRAWGAFTPALDVVRAFEEVLLAERMGS